MLASGPFELCLADKNFVAYLYQKLFTVARCDFKVVILQLLDFGFAAKHLLYLADDFVIGAFKFLLVLADCCVVMLLDFDCVVVPNYETLTI